MTINNKSETNYRGKCLGWPVTSYGAVDIVNGYFCNLCGLTIGLALHIFATQC